MNRDEEIRIDVLNELRWEPKITNPSAIGVAVKEGIVTLSGFVDNYMDELAAEAAATRVPGVEGIVQNIQVRLIESGRRDDLEIARMASSALDLNSTIPRDRVKVIVKDGWITLEGELDLEHQKEEAEATVSRITGVKGVTNKIVIRPQLGTYNIIREIEKAFQRAAAHHARHIEVKVENGKVILSGMVRAWFEKVEAEYIVRRLPGVKEVENRLELVPLLEGKEPIPVISGQR